MEGRRKIVKKASLKRVNLRGSIFVGRPVNPRDAGNGGRIVREAQRSRKGGR